jgi:saccharopine dehydrogenase-like NADP-dependent oxidoreductase
MKVVALGGAGDVGRTVVREAARIEGLHELIVADLDFERASAVAESAGNRAAKVTAMRIDVTSRTELEQLFADADVVLNMVGPFYRFGVPILDAAIQTRTHYLDICDDWEPTLEMLSRDAPAKAAGITAIIGMGASPGALNLLAVCAARELDEVTDLYTTWPIDVPMPGGSIAMTEEDAQADTEHRRVGPSAAVVHWIQQISGSIRTVVAGVETDTPPLVPVVLDYPDLGSGTAYTVGHPEPITLRRSLGIMGDSACLMIITPALAASADALRRAVDAKQLTVEMAAALSGESAGDSEQASAAEGYPPHGKLPPFFAWARGKKDGKAITVGARVTAFPSGLAAGTGLPLVIVLRQLLEGRISEHGVFPPEQAVDPDTFFADLSKHCGPGAGSTTSIVVVEKTA